LQPSSRLKQFTPYSLHPQTLHSSASTHQVLTSNVAPWYVHPDDVGAAASRECRPAGKFFVVLVQSNRTITLRYILTPTYLQNTLFVDHCVITKTFSKSRIKTAAAAAAATAAAAAVAAAAAEAAAATATAATTTTTTTTTMTTTPQTSLPPPPPPTTITKKQQQQQQQ